MSTLVLMGDQHRWDALGCAADGLEPWQRTWLADGSGGAPLVGTQHLDLREDSGEIENLIEDLALAPIRERLYAHLAQGAVSRAERVPARCEPVVKIARPSGPAAPRAGVPRESLARR